MDTLIISIYYLFSSYFVFRLVVILVHSLYMAFVRHVCSDLGLELQGPLCLGVDNKAAIAICENAGVTGRNKQQRARRGTQQTSGWC